MSARNKNPVAQGGMWSTPKASYSPATQKLLKDMMQESKLTNFQQRQLGKTLQGGGTLPSECNPTSSALRKKTSAPKKREEQKIVDPRGYSPQIRTKDAIESTGAYDREQFFPAPQIKYRGFYEKDKERLANVMAYGEDIPPPNWKDAVKRILPDDDYKPLDRFDELLDEIEERRKFMSDMEDLGQGSKYKTIIDTEISQLIREMELIDKKRSAELEKRIAAEDGKKQKQGIPHANKSGVLS